MWEFQKLCRAFERLSGGERLALMAESSVAVLARLHALAVPGLDPVHTLAGFIIGAVAADGKLCEQEYLLIYPSLVRVFGSDFDFASVKEGFRTDTEGRRQIADYTARMSRVLGLLDEELQNEVVTLCLCVLAIDGRVSLREKRYLKRLCAAE